MSQILIDPQAFGWEDTRSGAGRIRIVPTHGDLVPMALRDGHYAEDTAGTASGTLNGALSTTTDQEGAQQTSLKISVAAGLNNGYRLYIPFYGPVFGVSFRRASGAGSTLTAFGLGIDGEWWKVDGYSAFYASRGITIQDSPALHAIVTDLGDGQHHAEIHVASDPTVLNPLTIFGFLVDRRAGYVPPVRSGFQTSSTLTTANTVVSYGGSIYGGRTIRKILYCNTDAVARTVTVTLANSTIWKKQIAAGDVAEFDPGVPISFHVGATASGLAHAADANSVVRATVFFAD